MHKNTNVVVSSSIKLDWNVYHLTLDNGAQWVARVFRRPVEDLQFESDLMQHLLSQTFPAETNPVSNAVTQQNPETGVLITSFVIGTQPERNRKTFRRLGVLLGQLHAIPLRPPHLQRKGGAWHHLSSTGGLEEEIAASKAGLVTYREKIESTEREIVGRLISKLDEVPSFQDLPQAVVHPDFVLSNVIESPETSEWTIIDWAGVGLGPRILLLGYLLFSAAARGKLILVDSVLSGYTEHVRLEKAEINILETAVWNRPFTIACWDVFQGRKAATEVDEAVEKWCETAKSVVAKVRSILSSDGSRVSS